MADVAVVFDDFVEVAVIVAEVFVAVLVADGVEDGWKIGDSVAAAYRTELMCSTKAAALSVGHNTVDAPKKMPACPVTAPSSMKLGSVAPAGVDCGVTFPLASTRPTEELPMKKSLMKE